MPSLAAAFSPRCLRPALLGLTLVAALVTGPGRPLSAAERSAMIQRPLVELQELDKVTARVSRAKVAVGASTTFGTLTITVRACHESDPTDPPEAAAFLEIVDAKPSEPAKTVFTGWMFASSPALSALEHPIYDVWVLSCQER